MATKKPMKKPVKRVRRFQEGGEAVDKAAGLAISNKEPIGFFERLRMGNIDQEGSEAYNRLGAGRAKMDRVMRRDEASEAAANRMVDESRQSQAYGKSEADVMDAMQQSDMMQRGRAEGERDEKRMAPSPVAQAQNAALLAKKATPAASRPAAASSSANATDELRKYSRRAAQAAANARAKTPAPAPAAAPSTREERVARVDQAFQPPSAENTQKGLEAGTLGAVGAGSAALAGLLTGALYKGRKMYKARQAAKEASRVGAEKRAILKKQAEEGIDANLLDEFKDLASAAARPAKKKGGVVKKMAHGGSVKSSTASSRGDGIALRGKTRGKIY
jgi:hypothetical protein